MSNEQGNRPKKVVRALDTPPSQRQIATLAKTQPLTDELIEQYLGSQFVSGNIISYERRERRATTFGADQSEGQVVEKINFLTVPDVKTAERCEEIFVEVIRKSRGEFRERMPVDTGRSIDNPYGVFYFADRDELWRHGIYPLTPHQAEPFADRKILAGNALKKLEI